ncbi:hypothetical protein PG991_005954 [Apiospora marii]|uniref:Major facilitator superfamily (MFS) profile domain-containing protein n=1 Tax=Apiospora marii TaxID=335849 RepID=A0ABR1SAN2_9PEZI
MGMDPRTLSSHHLDTDSSDLASPSSSSGATAQLTPDHDPNSSSSDDYEKDDEIPWADDDYQDGRPLDLESGSGGAASYELQNLGRKPAHNHRDEDGKEGGGAAFYPRFQLYTPDEEQAVIGQVSLIVLSWGVVASLQAVATSYPILIFLRLLLGIGEAAFTGVPFFLSFFFKRSELAYRTALFIAAAPLATTFASSFAWIILKLGESGPIAPWRVLFLVEGFPSVIVAVIAWSVIPDSPQTARYLTPRERKVARVRLRHEKEEPQTSNKQGAESRLKVISSVLLDPKAWLTAVMFFLTNMAYSSLPVFLPMILKEMGHTALESQALSAPPYLIAFVAVLATAHLSDKLGVRWPFIIVHALASAAGYLALALARPLGLGPMLRYLAIYPAAVGFFNVVVLVVAWNVNNQPSESRRGGGFALMQVVGQCGPLVGTRLYPQGDGPYFEPGMWACAGAMAGVAAVALVLRFYLAWLNRRMDGAARDEGGGEESQGLVGSPGVEGANGRGRFRYML